MFRREKFVFGVKNIRSTPPVLCRPKERRNHYSQLRSSHSFSDQPKSIPNCLHFVSD